MVTGRGRQLRRSGRVAVRQLRRIPLRRLVSYPARQGFTAVLAANAIRPVTSPTVALTTMTAGWLTSELAPHAFALTTVDTALEVRRPGRSLPRAALGAANLVALANIVRTSGQAGAVFDAGLVEVLGEGYRDELGTRHPDLDWKTPLAHLVWPFRLVPRHVEVRRDVPYSPAHGRRGLLDVYVPQARRDGAPAPVLLQVHGGAWTTGTKNTQGLPLMQHMASRGWLCVAPNYRLSPRHAFPAHLVDLKCAIAWVREHAAEYGGDPDFIAITGGSAGGHLAALAALTPNDPEYQPGFEGADTAVQAAVPFYGVYDFAGITGPAAARMRDTFLGPLVVRRNPRHDLTPFQKASPICRVRPDAPPFYVIHGVNDTLVPVGQARRFVAALREVSESAVAYVELRGAQHAFDIFPSVRSQHSVRSADLFLRWAHDRWTNERLAERPPS